MLFNTVEFLIFFIIILVIYWVLPGKVRYLWLLAGSYYFYMQWNPHYILLLFSVTAITYAGGVVLDRIDSKERASDDADAGNGNVEEAWSAGNGGRSLNSNVRLRFAVLTAGLVICLSLLGIFKYADFTVSIINKSLHVIGRTPLSWTSKLILPVGISFYTLQSLGYLIDVYRGDTYAEKNFLKFALFVSFFPQLVAGPIERSKNLLKQLGSVKSFSYENIRKGFLYILYGMFLKVMIADRCAIFVDQVYSDCVTYGGVYVFIATILFAIQIYCDFHGYSTIARGAALTMGFELVENFNAPYFAKSVKEFWQRWHISLSTWFRDYLYIPLGGNRKGKLRKNVNLMIVFSISGLWHGADFSYVLWGFLNGFYQIIGEEFKIVRSKLLTFLLISLTWLFFRAQGIREALILLKSMVTVHNFSVLTDGSVFNLGIDKIYFVILVVSILLVFIVDYFKYKEVDVAARFLSANYILRCFVCLGLVFSILLFGCYGTMYDAASFIYFQF